MTVYICTGAKAQPFAEEGPAAGTPAARATSAAHAQLLLARPAA
jgi:hypothetical protein